MVQGNEDVRLSPGRAAAVGEQVNHRLVEDYWYWYWNWR